MSAETLVVPRFDVRLGRYVERIDLDLESLNRYAEQIGIVEAIEERAQYSDLPAEPITVNFQAGYCVTPPQTGMRRYYGGIYHLSPKPLANMPPADIDVFVGSSALEPRAKRTHYELEEALEKDLDDTIQEELAHATDPNLRFKSRVDDYIDRSHVQDDPDFSRKANAMNSLNQDVGSRMAGILVGSVFGGVVAFEYLHEHGIPYNNELSVSGGIVTFLALGYAGLKLFVEKKFIELERITDEVNLTLHRASPYEIYAKSQMDQLGSQSFISIRIGSFARRKIPEVKLAT